MIQSELFEYPVTCSICGIECADIDELADPDHHDWPTSGKFSRGGRI